MKNAFVASIFFLNALTSAQACEVCGCGVGNFYMGMVPKFNSKFIGVRYRYMNFSTHMQNTPGEFSKDFYQTVELWGGWKLGKKWQAMAFLPYQFSTRTTDDGTKISNGLGDVIVLVNYRMLNQAIGQGNQQLWIGGGLKAPTGSYKLNFNDPEINLGDPNAKSGTGSLDFLLNVSHTLSIQQWGINTTINYKVNTTNPDHYKFGNRISANSMAYYRFKIKNSSIAPVLGALYELLAANNFQKEKISMTGGYAAFGLVGMEMNLKKLAFGFNMQSPVAQNLSQNQTQAKLRGMAHLTFTL